MRQSEQGRDIEQKGGKQKETGTGPAGGGFSWAAVQMVTYFADIFVLWWWSESVCGGSRKVSLVLSPASCVLSPASSVLSPALVV